MRHDLRLLVISPCHNEEHYLPDLINSMISQTFRPACWLIVDDNSSDSSAEIIGNASRENDWIKYIKRDIPHDRGLGSIVAQVFNFGIDSIDWKEFDFILKLDCDLTFEKDVLEKVISLFDDPGLGMAGVGLDIYQDGKKIAEERYADYHVCGAFKLYRRQCFQDIGGIIPLNGWDILDETAARMHGWKTMHDPRLRGIHHRIQGEEVGQIKGRINWGEGAWAVGSHPLFAIVRGFYRMFERPFLIGGLAFIWGFFACYFHKKVRRNPDRDLIRFIRKEQIYRLFHGNRLPEKQL